MSAGEWLDRRVGWRKLMHEGLDEPIPGRSRWAYVFGSGLLFIFANQAVTGVFLSLYYVPSADHAHTTVSYIQKQVTGGSFIRGLHSYGSSAMIILLFLHLAQTLVFGAYKSRRELLWVFGCLLLLLVLGMSFTGYLLPWDQKAYSATAVATNIVSEIPLVGEGLKTFLRGGTEMGTLTISRFFTFHVFLIPALIVGCIALHVFLFRRAGAAGPPVSEEKLKTLPVEPFFPRQVAKDFVFGIAVIAALAALASWWPTGLGPKANPADPTFVPRPEWYYLPVFQWLKYWHGPASILGIIVLPACIIGALFALPFIDRSPERRPLHRPVVIGTVLMLMTALAWLGYRSHVEDLADPGVRARLASQEEAERRFSSAPFEPEVEGTTCTAPATPSTRTFTPQQSKGSLLFVSESCSGCHGVEAKGGAGLFRLTALDSKYSAVQLKRLLQKPNATMSEGGMEPVQLKDDDFESLIAYLRLITSDERK